MTEKTDILKRTVMWRPFIVDLWDTRLPSGEQRHDVLEVEKDQATAYVEAQIDYHPLDEARCERIGYHNEKPIHYPVFQGKISIAKTIF